MLTFKSHISLSFSYQGFLKEYLKNMHDLNVSLSVVIVSLDLHTSEDFGK